MKPTYHFLQCDVFVARMRGHSDGPSENEVVIVQTHNSIRRQPQLRISQARGLTYMPVITTEILPFGWLKSANHVNKILIPKADERSCWRRGQTIGKHVFFKSAQHHGRTLECIAACPAVTKQDTSLLLQCSHDRLNTAFSMLVQLL